jgi:murein DD-endopeptidase MepM/ murein hydrolase activator NlpD
MYGMFTQRVRRPGRVAATVLILLLALANAAQAAPTPSSTPTFDPNNPEDAKLKSVFQRFDAKRDVVEGSIRTVEQQLVEVENRLIKLRAELAKSEAELAKRTAQLHAAIAKLNAQKILLKDSAATIYMRGPFSYIDAILNADDISSLMRVDVYSQSVLGDFIRILHEVQALKIRVQKLYNTVRAHTIELREQTHKVEQEEAQIMVRQQSFFAQRQRLINGLVADFGGLDELKKHGFDIIIRAYSGTSNRIATELTTAQKSQDVAKTGEYVIEWPVASHRITSRYGWRIHPLWGYRSFHTGIDIGADYGSPITAAADGVITDVAYMGAYGLVVVIDHGHSIGTVYAHMSRTSVKAGDVVTAGDEIGKVGCTGWCTGPHIHFEVRLASKAENPIFWLNASG